jgi:hypothetical protein
MRSKSRFALGLIAIVVVGAVLLSGCLTIRSETVIQSDGSGSRTIVMAIDKSMMALAQQGAQGSGTPTANSQDPFADIKTSAGKISGATVDKYTDASGNEGVKVTIPFKTLDDLKTQQFGDKGQSMDKITYTKSGSVVTLNVVINSDQVTSGAANASGSGTSGASPSATKSPEEKAMAKQMVAAMGIDFSYALALPGKILDWQPKNIATYDPATNKILWTLDLTADKQPDIMVKWDNSQKPAPISAPAVAAAPAAPSLPAALLALPTLPAMSGVTVSQPSSASLDAVKAYAEALMNGDQAAYSALFANGKPLNHPLADRYPKVFGADLKVTYNTMVADPQTGVAQWTAERTVNGKLYTVTGVDILTLDDSGKITAIQAYVDPTQFNALAAVSK